VNDDSLRVSRQVARQRDITEAVMSAGIIRIEEIADRFGISLMTVHRDLDELEAQGLLRKARGVATALPSSLVESSDVFRASQQAEQKRDLARAAMAFVEPGQALFLDDSTTVNQITPFLVAKAPLTVITNFLTNLNELRNLRGITLVAVGGNYYNWCNSFMGHVTTTTIERLRADVFVMSTAAITDDICFHQSPETVDVKRAMFDKSAKRILIADHTKFEKRALYGLAGLVEFDQVIVDSLTREEDQARLRSKGVRLTVAAASS
jgi:DeoR/GlpR family transcriptional regulator of sugar metabolism